MLFPIPSRGQVEAVPGKGCTGEHPEVCCFYTLLTLAREPLPMGNLSFLPQFLGVFSPGSQEHHGFVVLGAHPTTGI